MKAAAAWVFACAAFVAQLGATPFGTWCSAKAQSTTNLLCAGSCGGLMDLREGFLVKTDGRFEATVWPNSGPAFDYSTTLNAEELEYLLVLLRYAHLSHRPEGQPDNCDGGNWEMVMNYDGKSNHVFWTSHVVENERGMRDLEVFLTKLTWQPEAARRLSSGQKEPWIQKSLQPYRLTDQVRPSEVEQIKERVRTAVDWNRAKALLEQAVPSLTSSEWCGLTALYLRKAPAQERHHALGDIWQERRVVWPAVPQVNSECLRAVLELEANRNR